MQLNGAAAKRCGTVSSCPRTILLSIFLNAVSRIGTSSVLIKTIALTSVDVADFSDSFGILCNMLYLNLLVQSWVCMQCSRVNISGGCNDFCTIHSD